MGFGPTRSAPNSGPDQHHRFAQAALTAARARAVRSAGAAPANSRAMDVISTKSSPHGTIVSKPLRSGSTFRAIKELGVRLCIDDFGTGYSSLSYLRNYPFDVLKIDRAFVQDAIRHVRGVSLLRAIIAMADSLDLEIVVEGVETEEQFGLLCELRCGFAQGYYFCAPLSAARIGIGGPIVDLDAGPSRVQEEPQGWLRTLKVRND